MRVFEDGWNIAGCPVNGPAVDAAGSFLAVAWFTAPQGRGMVRAAFSSDGGRTFQTPVLVDGKSPVGRVDVAILETGEAVVSWIGRGAEGGVEAGESPAQLRLRRVSPGGAAGPPLAVAQVAPGRSSGIPRILAAEDDLLLTWISDGDEPRLRSGRLPLKSIPRVPD